jgi:hypothetical protein
MVVICKQEPGSNIDAWVTQGQFALHAREVLVKRAGFNVKMLGLSYQPNRGGDWLKHPHHLMSTLPPSRSTDLSMGLSVCCGPAKEAPRAEKHEGSEEAMARIAADAAAVIKNNQHVVVYGSSQYTCDWFLRLVEAAFGSGVYMNLRFCAGLEQRDIELCGRTLSLTDQAVLRAPATLVLIEPGCFSTPLTLVNVGMVVSIVKSATRRVYDDELHFVTSSLLLQSRKSLLSQRWTGRGREGPDSPRPARIVEVFFPGEGESHPYYDAHIQNGTNDPLRECFAMVAAYPARALKVLPVFKAVEQTRDLIVRLRAMGLVTEQGNGFIATGKGRVARGLMDIEASLTLEAATALAGIDMDRMGRKVARSIVRLCFMKEMSKPFLVDMSMGLNGIDVFPSFLRRAAQLLAQGGPGRECVDRGLVWMIWATFEMMSSQVGPQGTNPSETVNPDENWPFCLDLERMGEAMATLASWERLVNLGPLTHAEQNVWNAPLTPKDLRMVEDEIARANYSTAIVIPSRTRRSGRAARNALYAVWLRSNEEAEIQGEFDNYLHAHRCAQAENVKLPAQLEHMLFGGLPLSISTDGKGVTSVTGLMWFDYDVIKSLIGDLEAQDADPRVSEVAMRD